MSAVAERQTRNYGSWPSPISAEAIAAGGLRLAEPRLDGGILYWLEGRAAQAGRVALVGQEPGQAASDVTPADLNVRSRVHEYGGGAYLVRDGRSFVVDFETQQVVELGRGALAPPGPRHADLQLSPDGRWLVAVEECDREGEEVQNRIIAYPTDGRQAGPIVVAAGRDFYASPRFSPRGDRLAFVAWDHPDMPWDATELAAIGWGAEGPTGMVQPLLGNGCESIVQPTFAPDGTLVFASDRSGWWNLYRLDGEQPRALCPQDSEFAGPMWVFGLSHFAFEDASTLLCIASRGGFDRLLRVGLAGDRSEAVQFPFEVSAIQGLRVEDGRACFLAGGPSTPQGVYTLDLGSGAAECHRSSLETPPDRSTVSLPRALQFPSAGGRVVHAFHYPPQNPLWQAPREERPPLLLKTHGGPTAAAQPVLDPRVQYWTTRGFAVLDVNYGGSTGYGRRYRESLKGQWGVVDVEDCAHAALGLAAEGLADRDRLLITGGSAGGYTTLCALTFLELFAAGASHYGIGDLELLASDTHKFESRYLDGLVGPYPEARARYRERSPIHSVDRLSCPVAFFQGLLDRVVPPDQAEVMAAALESKGIPHAHVTFAEEGHGFRRAESICAALEGELAFYGRVLGFETDAPRDAIVMRGAPLSSRS